MTFVGVAETVFGGAGACERREPACPWRHLTAPQQPSDLRKAFRGFSRRSRTQDSAGWSSFADTRQNSSPPPRSGRECFHVFRGGVSAEMSIRAASAGTSTTLGFESGEGWILREAGKEGVFGAGAGDFGADGDFQARSRGIGMSGRRFSLSPQARRNHPRNTGTLIRGCGDEFSRSGEECFQDFHPIHTERGRENIFRGLTRQARDWTRDRFSNQPRNEGMIFHASRRDFQTSS